MSKREQKKRLGEMARGANEPQHLVGDYGEKRSLPNSRDGLPTGGGTSADNDVSDPHPSNEEHYDRQVRPGGANPPSAHDLGPNNAIHDGKPKRQPPPRTGSPG